jgi:hypothetical protein
MLYIFGDNRTNPLKWEVMSLSGDTYEGSTEGCREGEFLTALFGIVGLADFDGDLVGDENKKAELMLGN